jgi:hypothetical protein
MLAQQVEIDQPVGIAFENGLAGIAALGDVVWRINRHHACGTDDRFPSSVNSRANPAMIHKQWGK